MYVGASFDAFAFTTKGAVFAGYSGARISDTSSFFAALAVGATNLCAVIVGGFGNTPTLDTHLIAFAANALANIDTCAVLAGFVITASNTTTGVFNTSSLDARKSCCTLLSAGLVTHSSNTFRTLRCGFDIINGTVAVIVSTVADLCFGFLRVALFPTAIDADLLALTTDTAAVASEVIIDFTIAVVVFSVTDFRFGLGARAVDPFSFGANLCSCATSGIAVAFEVIIDFAITVVVLAIANFRFGLFGCASPPFSGSAKLLTLATLGSAGALVSIDATVTIVISIVAGLRLGLGSRTIHPLAFGADFNPFTAFVATSALQAIVDFAIAVVVEIVADFRGRLTSGRTDSPFAFNTY